MDKDIVYERAMKFVDNMKFVKQGISNIYVFTSVDDNGNIIDEKYGMNLMTNKGFKDIYSSGNAFAASDTVKLFVGSGVSTVSVTDTSLTTPLFGGLGATNSNVTKAYNYPIYFSPSEQEGAGIITLISKFVECYYPATIDGYTDNYAISEYGIGTSASALWTHSRIYTDQGTSSSIVKTNGNKLIITIYMCLSLYENVIQNQWANNVFFVITTNAIMYNRMFESSLSTYKRNNLVYKRADSGTHSQDTATVQNRYTNSTIMPSFIVYDAASDPSSDNVTTKIARGGYIDGFIFACDGMRIIEPQRLTTPENITIEKLMSNNFLSYSGFADKFGTVPSTSSLTDYSPQKYPQLTHLIDPTAYLYDWKSHTWTNTLSVYNSNNRYYTETPSQTSCGIPIYYYNRGEMLTGYLYQNINPYDRILKVKGGGLTIYATNKYWTNTPSQPWIWIQDPNNVPAEARQCRYWITMNNSDSLEFIRESDNFQLLEKDGTTPLDNGYQTYGSFNDVFGNFESCDNYEYGWYMIGGNLYYPTSSSTFTISDSSSISLTYNKYIVTFVNQSTNKVYITDTSQLDQNICTPDELTLNFTNSFNLTTNSYRTESGTGFICIQSTSSGNEECVILDLRGSTIRQLKFNWKMSCAIWGTNKIAYIPAGTSDNNIYIFNLTTESLDGDPIPFPSGITSIPFIAGHTRYIWFTNASSFSYCVDILSASRECIACDYPIGNITNLYTVRMTAVDDVFILYRTTDSSTSSSFNNARYIKLSTPLVSTNLSHFHSQNSSVGSPVVFKLRYIYRQGAKATLVLLITQSYRTSATYNMGSRNYVVDFGGFMDDEVTEYQTETKNACCGWVLFGENLIYNNKQKIPLANLLPIKLTGKTDTITSLNTPKSVSNKQFLISYSNTPIWGDGVTNSSGIPPGVPTALTDSSGTIIAWS